jgi:hypothetical protein
VIYVEYISRRPGVELAEFHAAVKQGQEGWDASYAEDRLLLNVGRTWRLGPEPEYMGVWDSPGRGLERIDDWDRIFRAGHAEQHERVFRRVACIEAAGCYEPLRDLLPTPRGHRSYYAELFRATGLLDAVAAHYEARVRRHPRLPLALLVHRIGKLGPDPGGLAFWVLPDFAALAEIAADLDGTTDPLELVAAGTYADVGEEIL